MEESHLRGEQYDLLYGEFAECGQGGDGGEVRGAFWEVSGSVGEDGGGVEG